MFIGSKYLIMNKFLHKTLPVANVHGGLLMLRVIAAIFIIVHGYPKFLMLFSGEPVQFADFMGLGPTVSLALSAFAEFLCAIFVLIGLFTRLAAIPLVINMSVAVFYAHANDPFDVKEKALLFLLIFLFLLLTGAGKYSVDGYLYNSGTPRERRYI